MTAHGKVMHLTLHVWRQDGPQAAGRFVTTLESGVLPAGEHTMEWNGRDGAGHASASGVYFLRVRAPSAEETLKLVLLR